MRCCSAFWSEAARIAAALAANPDMKVAQARLREDQMLVNDLQTFPGFDIVRTMTGGQFNTSVIANEFYSQTFRSDNRGFGAALAVVLFILVIPIVAYNIRQLRRSEA